jgi:hypothetical protein
MLGPPDAILPRRAAESPAILDGARGANGNRLTVSEIVRLWQFHQLADQGQTGTLNLLTLMEPQ